MSLWHADKSDKDRDVSSRLFTKQAFRSPRSGTSMWHPQPSTNWH